MKMHNEILSAKKSAWMYDLAQIITVGTIALSVLGIVGYSVDLYRHGQQKHFIGWFSSAGFVLLTIPISVRLIVMHLTHWNNPNTQKYVVRIIWMIPIYSVESWLALRFKSLALYIETLRECYEAYVIFNFLYFLFALLGDEQQIVAKLRLKSPDYGRHKWPLSLVLSPWTMGLELLTKCKLGVLQYVIIKNLTAIVVCVLASFGHYREGSFRFDEGYLYQCVICNISQLWALYCLILFYFATKDELSPWRPVGKFLCVKMVVFFTWWQSIAISMLSATDLLGSVEDNWTVTEISKGLQDYLICIEMFVASIAFSFAFTHKDYISRKSKDWDDLEEAKPFLSAFLQSSLPDDIFSDIRQFAHNHGFTRKTSSDNAGENLSGDGKAAIELSGNTVSGSRQFEVGRKDSLRLRKDSHLSDNEEEQQESEQAAMLRVDRLDGNADTESGGHSSSGSTSRGAKKILVAVAAVTSSPSKIEQLGDVESSGASSSACI